MRHSRIMLALAILAVLVAAIPFVAARAPVKKGKISCGKVLADVVSASVAESTMAPRMPATGFAPQSRRGFTAGDQWEPAIAADSHGTIYVLYPQYLGVPGCPTCPSPTMILQVSRDRGTTWEAPRQIAPPGTGQWDAQIAVDPVDGRTVYAAWLQNRKSDTVVARSDDLGRTWSVVLADRTNAGTDKPILAVRGPHVYVGFNHVQKVWVASSHDGGRTFAASNVNLNGKLGWSLAGGGVVDPAGNVYFSWAGYTQNGGAKGPVNLYVSRSADGGTTWTNTVVDVSGAPPDCSAYQCGWAYLGAQITMAGDEAGTLYALWNMGTTDFGPERIYFARSTDGAASWSAKADVSSAPPGSAHAFPALVAGNAGDVRIAWMDARGGSLWNTYYRSSTSGGATWSAETDLSTYVGGLSYVQPGGFSYPFGDYFEMDIDDRGDTHAVWGEGLNYQTPGSIWYTRGR
ncbi:MAG TPA: exo-alpha-sialidase [Vicinamibacteria bacterium]|nr:exo-alpha-sialidase [Vicinamibacteria bacterium]